MSSNQMHVAMQVLNGDHTHNGKTRRSAAKPPSRPTPAETMLEGSESQHAILHQSHVSCKISHRQDEGKHALIFLARMSAHRSTSWTIRTLKAQERLGQVLYLTFACLRVPLPNGHSFSPSSSAQLRVTSLKRHLTRFSARTYFSLPPRAHNHLQALVFYYLFLLALVAWTRLDLLVLSFPGRRIRGLALKSLRRFWWLPCFY
jgi:hypothetical protein